MILEVSEPFQVEVAEWRMKHSAVVVEWRMKHSAEVVEWRMMVVGVWGTEHSLLEEREHSLSGEQERM